MNFIGTGTPLSQPGIDAAQTAAKVTSAVKIWSVLAVETSGCGYLPDRRPKILFERHIFSRLTQHAFDADDPDVSAPTPGGYGPGGANQYLRLQAAMNLNADAALQSASWGLGQIMGENYSSAGFGSVTDMINAFVASEDNQLLGMANFVSNSGMSESLEAMDWASFARLYNGPDYAANNYDGQLANDYTQYSASGTPNLLIRSVQIYLTYRGYAIGPIDSIAGAKTIAGVQAFQSSIKVPPTGTIDVTLLAQLSQ